MTNYESVNPKNIRTVFEEYFAINKNTNEINTCRKVSCAQCLFYGQGSCEIAKKKWLDQPAIDWDKDIDWEKVPVDTPVLVNLNTDAEIRRYFCKKIDDEPTTYRTFANGRTSWTAYGEGYADWRQCKLYRPEDILKYKKKEAEK